MTDLAMPHTSSSPARLAACTLLLLVLVAVDLGWLAAASYARRWIRSPRAVRLSNRVSATAMGGAAVALAAR